MVRLRSERWYSAGGQRHSQRRASQQVAGTRRVLSLCLLLALVIVLMQKAGDPQHVRRAFQTLGVPLERPQAAVLTASTGIEPADSDIAASSETAIWRSLCADVIPRILDRLTASELQHWTQQWFASPRQSLAVAQPNPTDPLAGAAQQVLDELIQQTQQADLPAAEQTQWLQGLQHFRLQWSDLLRSLANSAPRDAQDGVAPISPTLRQTLTDQLDQRLLDTLRDASPWTKVETLVFWRLLQRAGQVPLSAARRSAVGAPSTESNLINSHPSPLPQVSSLQLASEADSYRGRAIRFRGSVRRVERIERQFEPLGMLAGYWVLWLRGEDDALQPVAVYTTDPWAKELSQLLDHNASDFPAVEVEAIFAKRLAYASTAGLEVGPALFATSLTPLSGRAAPLASVNNSQLIRQFLMAAVAACLLAAAVVLPIVRQQRRKTSVSKTQRSSRMQGSTGDHKLGLWLWCLAAGLAASFSPTWGSLTRAQEPSAQPPWGAADAASSNTALTQSLVSSGLQPLSEDAAEELRLAEQNGWSPFPETLLKIIHAARRVDALQSLQVKPLNEWKPPLPLIQTIELTHGLQLQPQTLSGWVRLATPVVLSDQQQAWFQTDDQSQLFRVELQLDDLPESKQSEAAAEVQGDPSESLAVKANPKLVTVFCQQVPKLWLTSGSLRQPAQFTALALVDTAAETAVGGWPMCVLAARSQWRFPAAMTTEKLESQLEPALPPQLLELGQAGWDLSYFDAIVANNQQPLSRAEAGGFYGLLRISQTMGDTGSESRLNRVEPLVILDAPQENIGMPIDWLVRIVSATVVDIDDPRDQGELAGNGYVQFDGFVDIGRDHVRFQTSPGGGQETTRDFQGEFPVTIVSPITSPFIPSDKLATGERTWSVGEYVRAQGRFYRLWSYQTEPLGGALPTSAPQPRQLAPLVIAKWLTPTNPPQRPASYDVGAGWFGWALCAATLVILAGILWSAARKMKPTQRRL